MYRINKPVTSSPTVHRLYRVLFAIQCCLTSLILLGLACFCLLNIGICFWAVLDLQDVYKGRINTTYWEFQEITDRLALQGLQGLQVKLVTDKPRHLPRSYFWFCYFVIIILMCFYFISDFQDSQGYQACRECQGNPVLLVPRDLQVMTLKFTVKIMTTKVFTTGKGKFSLKYVQLKQTSND